MIFAIRPAATAGTPSSAPHPQHARHPARTSLAVAIATVLCLAAPAIAAPDNGRGKRIDSTLIRSDHDNPRGRVVFDRDGGFLTASSKAAPERVALDYVAAHAADFGLDARDARTLFVEKIHTSPRNGVHYVTLGQQVDGIRIHNARLVATVDPDGRLALVGGRTGTVKTSGSARLTAGEAIGLSAERGHAGTRAAPRGAATRAKGRHVFDNPYARSVFQPTPVSAELVWHLRDDGSLRLAWLTDVEVSGTSWYETLLDAESGEILARESRYAHDSHPEGTVFTGQHPDASPGGRAQRDLVGLDGNWSTGTTTSGNNVNAYQDRGNNNAIGYQPQGVDGRLFNFPFTDAWRALPDGTDFVNIDEATWNAAIAADRDATITQLFYYTNDIHDWLYGYGFDEASGNFQVNNFGRGGAGGDPVLAEAHDGIDFGCQDNANPPNAIRCANNANFATPADGNSPRMQMYLWIRPNRPYRDGSLDGDVIAHEYGHGVSNRLVPGAISGATNQSGSLGEGWSDAISFLRWGDTMVGEYVTGNATSGIRNFAYDTHPWLYGNYSTNVNSPHRNGEIWAAMMYQIRVRLGIDDATWAILDGMRSTPNGPNARFIDARDGIIAADQADGAPWRCALWASFSLRGLGTGAASAGLHAPQTNNFTAPADCLPSADAGGPYSTPEGTDASLSAAASASGSHASAGAIVSYEWDLDNDGQYDDATGISADFTAVGQDGIFTVGLRVTDEWGLSATASVNVTVTNVLPTVNIDAIAPIDELGTVTVSGTITDPGWLEPLTATIDFDDGAGPQALAGTLENLRPDATLTFSVHKQYGDDGLFDVQICAQDRIGGAPNPTLACDTAVADVANIDPEVAIDTDDMQDYGGNPAFVLKKGEELSITGTSVDPGSDDLTFTWDWDDGSSDDRISRVNPPADDPLKSPSIQPRDVTLSQAHTYGEACLYDFSLIVVDDDGGQGSDNAAVVVTGNASASKGSGWWLNQYRPASPNDFSDAELQCYLDIVAYFSLVFDQPLARQDAEQILHSPAKSPARVMLREQLMAAWLNFANGAIGFDTPVVTSGKKKNATPDSTFGAAILQAESVHNDPNASDAQLRAQKDIVERIVLRDGG